MIVVKTMYLCQFKIQGKKRRDFIDFMLEILTNTDTWISFEKSQHSQLT